MQVVDNATARRIDAACIAAGTAALELMEAAGAGAAEEFLQRCGEEDGTTLIFCGRGNNGGDGLVMARHLHLAGHPVAVFRAGGDASPDCATNLERARDCGVRIEVDAASALVDNPGRWLVDALLGSGFSPPLRGELTHLVALLRDAGRRIFALDAPTGIDADTGDADALTPVAAHTVIFGPPRLGIFRAPARAHCGRLVLVDPGFDPAIVEAECAAFTPSVEWVDQPHAASRWPDRVVDAHKYKAGSLLIVAGSAGMSGAAALAAGSAHRAGAGLVEVLTPAPVAAVVDTLSPESLVRALAATESGGFASGLAEGILQRAAGRSAMLLGCGVGDDPDTAALMVELCAALPVPAVIDADALNAFDRTDSPRRFPGNCVLTPHAAELARLTGSSTAAIESDRIAATTAFAAESGAVVLLKGAPTVVAGPDGALALIGSGGPELATAGSGDVLAGVVGALLAAGLSAMDAATTAAWVHGRAGEYLLDDLGTCGLIASDLPLEIARVGRDLEAMS